MHLSSDDADFRRLARKHEECERRLAELQSHRFLTEEEKVEATNLKKMKLLYKDRMAALRH